MASTKTLTATLALAAVMTTGVAQAEPQSASDALVKKHKATISLLFDRHADGIVMFHPTTPASSPLLHSGSQERRRSARP